MLLDTWTDWHYLPFGLPCPWPTWESLFFSLLLLLLQSKYNMISAVVLVCRVCPAQQLLLICASLLCHPRCPNGHNSLCQFCHLLPSSSTPVLSSPVISFYLCQSPELWRPHFVLLWTAASPWLIFWLSHRRWPFLWPFGRCHYTWSSWKSSLGFLLCTLSLRAPPFCFWSLQWAMPLTSCSLLFWYSTGPAQ